jgi:hypothetical protein
MTQIHLDYAPKPSAEFQWPFLRLTAYTQVFVSGWFLFSLYVWLLFGSYTIGRKPDLRLARDFSLTTVVEITFWLAALNVAWLIFQLARSRQPWHLWFRYLTLVWMPMLTLLITEAMFGDFVVS